MKRRRLIQYAGWGSVGLFVGLNNRVLATETLRDDRFINLQAFSFDTIQLNRQGQEIQRHTHTAKFSTVDLGNQVFLEMVAINPGSFLMGAPRGEKFALEQETPQHRVQIQPFFIGKYPITQAQWQAVAQLPKVKRDLIASPAHFKGANLPVESVSWLDATEFCDRLSQLTEVSYRLPSEAEWEYACRAGTTTPFAYGQTLTSQVANYGSQYTYAAEASGEYRQATVPVGQFPPNAFGLYDMHGNVWEWCADHWHNDYAGAPANNQPWLKGGNAQWRALRGGGWSDYPSRSRSAERSGYPATSLNRMIGFRVSSALV